MTQLMFVDDEPNILAGLRRMLYPLRKEWSFSFMEGGQAALDSLSDGRADVVVSDMKMPGMDGAEFLGHVRTRFPGTIRLGLSGYSEGGLVLRGLDSIHQFLAKPAESGVLVETVRTLLMARTGLRDELGCAIAGLGWLPCNRASLEGLQAELSRPEPSLERVAELVAWDVGLAAKVLQLVHTSFFGTPRPVGRAQDACRLLGLSRLRELVGRFWDAPVGDEEWLRERG
ncbi:MAG: response regulator, partial [Candidatus Eremiobacterota bacterium]